MANFRMMVLLAAMVLVIVAMDFAFFRGHIWWRLAANVAVVAIFGAIYLTFLRRA